MNFFHTPRDHADTARPTQPIVEEDLLPVAARAEGGADAVVNLEIQTAPEYEAVPAGESRPEFFANVTISSADASADVSTRGGLDIVCVMDVSGSMMGEKISLVKDAMKFVVQELTDNDRLALVTFDHQAEAILGLTRMGNGGKDRATTTINSMAARGGTNIYSGLAEGMRMLETRRAQNSVTCIFLLTDGQDSRSNEAAKFDLAVRARTNGWPLVLFAFGDDHDVQSLSALAETAGSSYVFVRELVSIADAFGGALGAQLGVCGKKLKLEITLPGFSATAPGAALPAQAIGRGLTPGLTPRPAPAAAAAPAAGGGGGAGAGGAINVPRIHRLGTSYPHRIAEDGLSAVVEFPNLLAGEHRDVCVMLSLPRATTPSTARDFPVLLSPSLTIEPVAGFVLRPVEGTTIGTTTARNATEPGRIIMRGPACLIARPTTVTGPQVRTPAVEREVLRLTTTRTVDEAMALADMGNLDAARTRLLSCQAMMTTSPQMAHISVTSLSAQINDSLRVMESRTMYEAGRTEMVEGISASRAQRSVFSKGASSAAYCVPRSAVGQSKGYSARSTPRPVSPPHAGAIVPPQLYHKGGAPAPAGGVGAGMHAPPPIKAAKAAEGASPAKPSSGAGSLAGGLVAGVMNVLGLGGAVSSSGAEGGSASTSATNPPTTLRRGSRSRTPPPPGAGAPGSMGPPQ